MRKLALQGNQGRPCVHHSARMLARKLMHTQFARQLYVSGTSVLLAPLSNITADYTVSLAVTDAQPLRLCESAAWRCMARKPLS